MNREYRAHINIDYTKQNTNGYQRMIAALTQAGWTYVETSALVIETSELSEIWRGMEIVAKQNASAGTLSAFTLHVQGSVDLQDGINYAAIKNHPNALEQVLTLPFPSPEGKTK